MLVLNSSSFASQAKSGLDTAALCKSDLANLKISMLESDHISAKFDLNCELVENENSLFGHFEYNTDLFNHVTIEQVAKHFLVLLKALIENPEKDVNAVSFLEKELIQQTLPYSHGESHEYPSYDNVSDYLLSALKEHSHSQALRFEGSELSYGELRERG